MMKKVLLIIALFFLVPQHLVSLDLTIMGPVILADGLGRVSLGILDCLKDDLNIRLDANNLFNLTEISDKVLPFLQKDARFSTVILVTDPLFRCGPVWSAKKLNIGAIKIAYSMIESSRIPHQWVTILNEHFDAVVVPDEYLKKIYGKSGVTKPIFVIPCPSYLQEFLSMPKKTHQNDTFIFGCSGTFIERKNYLLLLKAFAHEFGNDERVKLVLHGRNFAASTVYGQLLEAIKDAGLTNVEIRHETFSQQEYLSFIASLDCYVFISQGEGFSFTPREALALGVPCILSNNTVHKTLCRTGYVVPVPSKIKIPAYYPHEPFLPRCGYFFDCTMNDVRRALREVYTHYDTYLNRAHKGRKWVKAYLPENLRNKYLNLVKPKEIIFGNCNRVEDGFLETDDFLLYEKYLDSCYEEYG